MADTDTGFHDAASGGSIPLIPVREGLPPTYRMRAEAHYVEQLSARSADAPVRLLEITAIERWDGPAPAAAFVDSIRRHGVLQPLIVSGRSGRYRVIAGHKRLAAAVAAGLGKVPCLLQRVDEEQAGVLAEATNLPAVEPTSATGGAAAAAGDEAALHQATEALSALASSANLLSDGPAGSALTHGIALDLVRAEAARALHLLLAHRLFGDRVPLARSHVDLRPLAERAVRTAAPECRLRNIEVRIDLEGHHGEISGDEALLGHALTGLLMATAAILPAGRTMTIAASEPSPSDTAIRLIVSQEIVALPEASLARAFDAPWPVGAGAAHVLVLLQAVRRVAELHGGRAHAVAAGTGTALSLTLPRGARRAAGELRDRR